MEFSSWVFTQQVIAQQGGGGGLMSTVIMFGVIFLIFWVILIRPQKKELERHQALLSGLKVGDEVVTAGGLFGKVSSVDGAVIQLEIARGTKIKVERQKIQKTQEELDKSAENEKKESKGKDDDAEKDDKDAKDDKKSW